MKVVEKPKKAEKTGKPKKTKVKAEAPEAVHEEIQVQPKPEETLEAEAPKPGGESSEEAAQTT
jgi:hypothetical protein